MDVQRPARTGETEQQAARPILVIGVILDNFTNPNGLPDLIHCDGPQDSLVNGVFGKLEQVLCTLLADVSKQVHALIIQYRKFTVLREIEFTYIRRNEVSQKASADNALQVMKGANKPLYIAATEARQHQPVRSTMIIRTVALFATTFW